MYSPVQQHSTFTALKKCTHLYCDTQYISLELFYFVNPPAVADSFLHNKMDKKKGKLWLFQGESIDSALVVADKAG